MFYTLFIQFDRAFAFGNQSRDVNILRRPTRRPVCVQRVRHHAKRLICVGLLIILQIANHLLLPILIRMNPAVAYIVRNLKKELVTHGGTGYHALQCKFRIMDDDNSKTINYAEFKKGMTELGLKTLGNSELRALFGHFGKYHPSLFHIITCCPGCVPPQLTHLMLLSLAILPPHR